MEALTLATVEYEQEKYFPAAGDGVTLHGNGDKRGIVRLVSGKYATVDWVDDDDCIVGCSLVARAGLDYCPTPQQIEAAATAMRRGWSPSERAHRNCYRQPAKIKQYATPPCAIVTLNNPNLTHNQSIRIVDVTYE